MLDKDGTEGDVTMNNTWRLKQEATAINERNAHKIKQKLMKYKNNNEDATDLMLCTKRLKLLQLINFWDFWLMSESSFTRDFLQDGTSDEKHH